MKHLIIAIITAILILNWAGVTIDKLPAQTVAESVDMAKRTEELKSLKWGMFICWSFSTFSGREWTPGVESVDFFKATEVDTDQWVRTAKEAGMGYILFLTKHHDGFCLWDTKTTDRKVTKAPLGRDVLAELRKSCDKYGIKLALYFSEGEFNDNKTYHRGGYTPQMKKAQLKELLTEYGPIEYIWFDHAQGTGGLNHEETVKWCHQWQPGTLIGFNHGEPAGEVSLREVGRPGPLGDAAAASSNGDNEKQHKGYLLAEFTYPIMTGHDGEAMWFYSLPKHDNLCSPAEKIYLDYLGAVKYGNIFSLDVGPDYEGKLRDIDVKTLQRVGRMICGKEKPTGGSLATDKPAAPNRKYNVVWDSPSTNATGSMPLSGGDLGLNVWVEGDDLLFYIGSPDSRIEDQKLVKLGRVRMTFIPSPFRKNFRQELNLTDSSIRISGETDDGKTAAMTLWVDAFQPVVHVEMDSESPVIVNIAYESWRFLARPVSNGLEWCYRLDPNKSDLPGKIKQQRLEPIADKIPDPLRNLTLGGRIVGQGLVADGTSEGTYMKTPFKSWKLKTAQPVTTLDLRVLLRVVQDDSLEVWRAELDKLQRTPSDRSKTIAWWREFWNRSWININPGAKPDDMGWETGRNYQLFRYMLAANRTGKAPTLFNGGIFTFDNPLPNANAFGAGGPNPDERAWWECLFMAQNQRWVYWPMLKNGDIDLLDVGLDFYRDRAALQEARSSHLMEVEGTPFNESLDIYGLIGTGASASGHNAHEHLTYHYTTALEFAFMMLEECRFTGRPPASSLPVMLGVLKFYDSFYQQQCRKLTGKPLDANGKLVIYPGNSCEMGVGCKNHSDAVGGLQAITAGLLQLDIPAADRTWVESFAKRIPSMPIVEKNGKRVIALAESWQSIFNPNEFPQLYNLFPFHRYGVGLPDLDVAMNTWNTGGKIQKESLCWKYGNTGVAMLGLAHEAKDYAIKKFLYPVGKDCQSTVAYGNCAQFKPRFPAFWSTYPFDAFPDMDHGGCAMVGLQEMLLQTPGDRILILPAWPKEWDVDFKLHAPKNTTVECEVRGGKILKLVVIPESRKKDIEIIGPLSPPPPPE